MNNLVKPPGVLPEQVTLSVLIQEVKLMQYSLEQAYSSLGQSLEASKKALAALEDIGKSFGPIQGVDRLHELKLSVRAHKLLNRAGIYTLLDLTQLTEPQLRVICQQRGNSSTLVDQIKETLFRLGHTLRPT